MSINWVMLKEGGNGFVPLPKERILHASPNRTAISIATPNKYPGTEPLQISSGSGIAYVTNQRVVYLPSASTPQFQSFSAPILNLLDSRVTAPWFGANAWVAVLKPVTGGGIPPQHAFVEAKLTFKDGGAYDFHQTFEEIKERLGHAVENARESGRSADLTDVPFEQLPAYEASGRSAAPPPQQTNVPAGVIAPTPVRPQPTSSQVHGPVPTLPANTASSATRHPPNAPPNEPPPGYEEAQSASVMESLEESVRKANS